jgi:DNA-binding PucR family transcriptional regulator
VPLDHILEALGAPAVDVLAGPTRPVTAVRIYDPWQPDAIGRGELVLAVNLPRQDVSELVRRCADLPAAAVALKGAVPPNAVTAAKDGGLALLAVSNDITWDQVFRVAQTVTTATDLADADAPVRDLFSLANAIAALVGGAVTIEDPRSTLLAYSTLDQPIDGARQATILGRSHGSSWAQRLTDLGVLRPLIASPGVVTPVVDPTGEARPRLAASVGAGGELLGFVWVVEGDRPFTDADEQSLAGALPLVALHILRHRASGDLTRRQRGTALREALQAAHVPDSLATDLGIGAEAPCAIAAFRLLVDDDVELTVKRAKAVDLITTAAEAFRRRVVCAWIDHTVYALFPDIDRVSSARLLSLVEGIARQAQGALAVGVLAGVGSTVSELNALRLSRDDADRVVRVLQDRGASTYVAHVDEVRVPATLLAVRDLLHDRPEAHLPEVSRLEQSDAEHGTQHAATLRAYALAGGSIAETAKALSLHPNSVRYRIARVQELIDLDLSSPDALLLIALHFHVT